jgi:hypothetical protein
VSDLQSKARRVKKACSETYRKASKLWQRIDQTLQQLETQGVEEPEDDDALAALELQAEAQERRLLRMSHVDQMWYLREQEEKREVMKDYKHTHTN